MPELGRSQRQLVGTPPVVNLPAVLEDHGRLVEVVRVRGARAQELVHPAPPGSVAVGEARRKDFTQPVSPVRLENRAQLLARRH